MTNQHHQHRGKYPDELRERAVRMVLDHEGEYESQWEAICSVAEKLGPTAETVRLWVRRAEVCLCPPDPQPDRLGRRTQLLSDRTDRLPLRFVLALMIEDHPH